MIKCDKTLKQSDHKDHFVPQVYLRRFLDKDTNKLHVYDRQEDRWFEAPTKRVCFELGWDKLDANGTDTYLTDHLKALEPSLGPFLQGLKRENSEYHTSLFPDSILNNESPYDFQENKPFRNAITKVYISRALFRGLRTGDNIVFYRNGGMYAGVITTIGIVNNVYRPRTLEEFKNCCKRRTIFSDAELESQWNYNRNKPFVVEFLYAYSFPSPKVNLKTLYDKGVFCGDFPRGFAPLSKEQFETMLRLTRTSTKYIVE